VEQAVLSKKIIDGKLVAKEVREELKTEVLAATAKYGRKPGLAVVLIGDNPASHTYVKNKVTACKNVGIESFLLQYDKDIDEKTVVDIVHKLNNDPLVDGILVQLPLPKHLPTQEILSLIDPAKDVDGLTAINLGRLARGDEGLFPCTPLGIMRLLAYYKVPVKGKNVVVLGRSHLVGKPVALMLLSQDATVTICHSKTSNLPDVCRQADVLVAACGQPEMVKGDWVKEGAVVIDVGTTRVQNADGSFALKGDVEFDLAFENASLITPVPGGVGPMTIAMLLVNTQKSFEKRMQAKTTSTVK
jgi:methylenetetrahydrofolate dehydrogenase (NADP+)/methenyltetrahydrofolate cyclohydrolase